MMFPYMSSYMHLMRGLGGGATSNPYDPYDMGDTSSDEFHGFGSSSDDRNENPNAGRRRGLYAGLTALGTSLLEAAPRGDWSGGLARGAAGFAESFAAERERTKREELQAAEERRRQAQDARAEEQERDRNRADDIGYEGDKAKLDAWRSEQARGKQARERTGKSADQMVAEINELAAKNPNDQKLQVMARRAAGYALGEDSDLNKLADLHEQMTGQAFRQSDADWKTDAEIERDKRRIAEGVDTDPKAAERRANEQLEISRGHLSVSRENATTEKGRATQLQVYDRVEKRVKEKVDARVAAHEDRFNQKPGPDRIEQWRREALAEAWREVQDTMGSAYRYTSDGVLEPDV